MSKVMWKSYIDYMDNGLSYKHDPKIFNQDETLLARIQSMPEGKHIGIYAAYHLFWDEVSFRLLEGDGSDSANEIYKQDWVKWISSQGYKIFLKGDEYA